MLKKITTIKGMITSFSIIAPILYYFMGWDGLVSSIIPDNSALFIILYIMIITHLTITGMSVSLHRYHTHKGVILNPILDSIMQIFVWSISSISKLDWVSVHLYHHAHSDKEKDPHSPIHKGFWHVFLQGALDYNTAKGTPEVLKLRKRLSVNKLEYFISEHLFVGPYILTAVLLLSFGLKWGVILCLINYFISPIFAIGGVNALAHWWGYKNHKSGDNSRNVGFLVPLNWMVCGEMDHNNHHGHQRSCSFRHKWYEFDIGYVYIKIFEFFKLAEIKVAYSPIDMKRDIQIRIQKLLENNQNIIATCEKLANEFNLTKHELNESILAYMEGKKLAWAQKKIDLQHRKESFYAHLDYLQKELNNLMNQQIRYEFV